MLKYIFGKCIMAAAVVDNQSGKQSRIQGLGNFDHSHTAVEYYFGVSNTHERKDFIEHAERVAEIVEIYAGDIVSPAVVDAALLHDVAERVMDTARPPEVRQAAARMVAERLTSPDLAEESLTYLASVIGYLGFIETAA